MAVATESATECKFKGKYSQELERLYVLIERLWKEHRTSPTKAGDELIFAFGNLDYVVVINQDVFNGVVEVKTKFGNVDGFVDSDSQVTCKLNTDPKEGGREGADIKLILETTVKALEQYYYNRSRRV